MSICGADGKRQSELRRRFGHEPLCKMDLMDPMDQMDMPQWQQTNRHGTHAIMADGNTRLVCERPKLRVTQGLFAKDQSCEQHTACQRKTKA